MTTPTVMPDPAPHHFSAHREGPDQIRLEGWASDGENVATLYLTYEAALDSIARLARALSNHPF